jgi:hypothetical protein
MSSVLIANANPLQMHTNRVVATPEQAEAVLEYFIGFRMNSGVRVSYEGPLFSPSSLAAHSLFL